MWMSVPRNVGYEKCLPRSRSAAPAPSFCTASKSRRFAHLYGADRIWLERWKGASPTRLYGDGDFPTLADLRARWDELEAEQRQFVEPLKPADLGRPVAYKDTRGNPYSLPLGPLLQHVANHATHHRSEIATMHTLLSGSPPGTDLSRYLGIVLGMVRDA